METLDKGRFIGVFKKFNDDLRAYNGSQFASFTTGVPAKWESYKPIIRNIALQRLEADKWTTNDVGSGSILAAVIHAIEIKESQDVRNNLVPWEPRHNQPSETGRLREELGNGPARQRFERHVFDLFREQREPADILDDLVDLIGRRYSLIAYLFYVFDDNRLCCTKPLGDSPRESSVIAGWHEQTAHYATLILNCFLMANFLPKNGMPSIVLRRRRNSSKPVLNHDFEQYPCFLRAGYFVPMSLDAV